MKNLTGLATIFMVALVLCLPSACSFEHDYIYELGVKTDPAEKQHFREERVEDRATGGRFIFDTHRAQLTYYWPSQPNGQCVVIFPGGGYAGTAFDKEGVDVAHQLVAAGITACVVKYRTPANFPLPWKQDVALLDSYRALELVKEHAEGFQIDLDRIGVMGFSAGGHLAAQTACDLDLVNYVKSDLDLPGVRFQALIYPVITMDSAYTHMGSRNNLIGENASIEVANQFSMELAVEKDTPPCFLVHSKDDKAVPIENAYRYLRALDVYGISNESHISEVGGHGFGMTNPQTGESWMPAFLEWIKQFK